VAKKNNNKRRVFVLHSLNLRARRRRRRRRRLSCRGRGSAAAATAAAAAAAAAAAESGGKTTDRHGFTEQNPTGSSGIFIPCARIQPRKASADTQR
jgi:hypothetical protein